MRAARPALSLKGRALRLLSQREHSPVELRRKLAAHAASVDQLDTLLAELEQSGYLSASRFAQSLAHRRGSQFGLRRIEHEMQAHQLDASVSEPVIQALRATERDRALQAWRKRFGERASNPQERARQQRFLAQRGFTSDAIGWVIRHGAPLDDQ